MQRENYASFNSESIIYSHCSYFHPRNDYFNLHNHPQMEMLLFIKGEASYVIEGKIFKLMPFDCILISPNVHHYLRIDDCTKYERYDIMFDSSLLPKSISARLQSDYNVFSLKESPQIMELFSKLDSFLKIYPPEDSEILLKNTSIEILYKLCFEKCANYTGSPYLNPALEEVLNYIHEHLLEIKELEEICNSLYISKSHLHKMFTNYMQITPKKYITQKRLNLAQQMLASGEKPHKIYSICGFEDYTAFYRAYKKHSVLHLLTVNVM